MQTQNPPTQVTATVLQSKDPDIAPGTQVQVTGYTATVPLVKRQAAIGAPQERKDVTVSFGFDELSLNKDNPIHRAAGPEGEVMPCCGYQVKPGQPSTIFWNPFNELVQCHNCGQTFLAESLVPAPQPPVSAPHPEKREKLPDTRPATTFKFTVGGQEGFITVGFYPDGRPGEIFIVVQRQGSTLQGFADAWARSLSMLLQYGVPVSEIARMFAYHKFEPCGFTNHPQIKNANSLVDFTARLLGYLCIPGYAPGGEPVSEVSEIPDVTA